MYYFLLLACSFLAAASALYDAKKANIEDFPYQAGIKELSATIISKNWILTADKVLVPRFYENTPVYVVRAGVSSHLYKDRCKGSIHHVEKVIKYTDEQDEIYLEDPKGYAPINRLVLMRVKEPFQFDETRQPIQLFKENEKLVPGTIANVSGFGLHSIINYINNYEFDDQYWEYKLQSLEVPIMDQKLCNQTYLDEYEKHHGIPKGYVCADYSNNTGRRSDHNAVYEWGGSLTVNNKLAGILSMRVGLEYLPQNPKLFIDIAYYRKWIDQNVDQPLL